MSGADAVAPPASRSGRVVAVLALAGMCASFLQSLVIPLIADIPELFSVTRGDSGWILTGTLLSAAIITPLAGRLGDLYGKRRVLVVIVALVVVGAVVAALAPTLSVMIAGRVLQGGMAAAVPLGVSILRDVLPAERLTTGIGLVSASLGVGGALGFPLSAVIYHFLGWHALFVTGAVLTAIVLVAIVLVVPPDAVRTDGTFDVAGAVLLAGALTGLLLAISKAADWGVTSAATLATAAAGVVLLAVWIPWELRSASPLVDLRLAFRRPVLLTNLATGALGFATFGFQIATPIVVQLPPASGVGLGQNALVAGLCLMPAGVLMLATSPLGSRVTDRFDARLTLVCGLLTIGLCNLLAPFAIDGLLTIALVNFGIGAGFGFAFGAVAALITTAVPRSQTAEANGVNTLVRSVGSAVGSATFAAILAGSTTVYAGIVQPDRFAIDATYVISGIALVGGAAIALLIPTRARPTLTRG